MKDDHKIFKGLQHQIFLTIGSRVSLSDLTKNIWSGAGLFNSAQGVVEQIIYKKGDKPP